MGPMPNDTLGKYELLGVLATGGMGEIFLARHRGPAGFSKLLVVKRILRHLASDPAFVAMFLNEAKLAGLLMHPNIVQIYELGHESDDYFIAMEYVRGHNLRSVLRALRERGETVDPGLSAQIAIQALEGLHYAHTLADGTGAPLEIVHRDVSPDNILISAQGAIKLADFGIAKAFNAATSEHSGVKGKFAYMAPEQLNGERIDRRADVYSVGCILHECLAGAPRFAPGSAGLLVSAILKGEAPALSSLRPDLPPKLLQIVDSALCVDREKRFGSAREMTLALEETLVDAGRFVGSSAVGDWLAQAMGNPVPPSLLRAEATAIGGGRDAAGPGTKVLGAQPVPADDASGATLLVGSDGPRPARRRLWAGLGAAAAAALIAMGWAAASRRSPGATPLTAASAAPETALALAAPRPDAPVDPGSAPAVALVAEAPPPSVDAGATAPRRPAAAPTQIRATAAPRERKTGRITVLTSPWAKVYWNDQELGVTPMTQPVELPAGRQVLVFRNPDLHLEKSVPVDVPPGEIKAVKVNLDLP